VGSRAKPEPTNDFGAHWSQKVQLWWQLYLLIFLNKKCNFMHKNKLGIVWRDLPSVSLIASGNNINQ